jgi:dihydroorotase
MDIQICQGRIIDPSMQIDRVGSIYISDGKIVSIDAMPPGFRAEYTIDAEKMIVCPGFIDLYTRLREPGQSNKASIASETRAAAKSGITTLCVPPDTAPVIDTPAVAELIKEKAELAGYPQVLPIGALTRGLEGIELSSMFALKNAGCPAVSNADQSINNLLSLRRAMEYAASHELLLIYRPEDHWLRNKGCAHEGAVATRYGLPGIPEVAETIALAQCLELVRLTGCRVHFSQISCARSVRMLEQAKADALPISADTCIHQLHLTEDDIEPFNSVYHVLPPFRTANDKQAIRAGLAGGIINAICSAHQPHDTDAKFGSFPETEPGISALETLLPLILKLVDEKVLTLLQALDALTRQPAEILHLQSGKLMPGAPADICIFDPETIWTVDENNWFSRGKNTPFWGMQMQGKVNFTLQNGKIIYSLEKK